MCCAKMAKPIEMPFGGLTLRNHVIDGIENLERKGQFWRLSGPLKSNGILLQCVVQKR